MYWLRLGYFIGGRPGQRSHIGKLAVSREPCNEASLHSFRRTYENLLRQAGVDQLGRPSLAGWRSEEAQEIYAGVDQKERGAAAQALVRLVMRKGS